MPQFLATCATSLEYLLVDELRELGAQNVKEGLSVVNFEADWPVVYRALMWSRIASRILYPLSTFVAKDEQALYDQVSIIDWSQHISSTGSFLVNSQSFRSELSHTKYISQRVKDAIVDHFRDLNEQRPDVEFDEPDVVIQCRIRQNNTIIAIDLAGVGLHHRGYRTQGGAAPIKENLAAALLIRAGWQKQCLDENRKALTLYDPMCGSGTFLIEAAMMALDIAPGRFRKYLGLFGWQQFNNDLWEEIKREAEVKKSKSINSDKLTIMGTDINPKVVAMAQNNVVNAEFEDCINVQIAGIDQITQFQFADEGLVIVNPPYSERLGDFDSVKSLYSELGIILKETFTNWQVSVLSPNKEFGHSLGIRARKIYKFNNGSIACELLNFKIEESSFVNKKTRRISSIRF